MHDNYYNDPRVRAGRRVDHYTTIDAKTMLATVEIYDPSPEVAALDPDFIPDEHDYCIVTLPVAYSVCPTCEGRGKHVNPSIDCNGLTAEDFAEDPDFAEDYFRGNYDVDCYGCHGQRVVAEIDDARTPQAVREAIARQHALDDQYAAIEAAERRMGA